MSEEMDQPTSDESHFPGSAPGEGEASSSLAPQHGSASVSAETPPADEAPRDEPPPSQPPEDAPPVLVADKEWYILKVQSNREDSIRDSLARRVKIEGLDQFFGDILVPIEKVSEFKNGKKRTVKRKLWPGYIVVHMEINDLTWHLVRGTPGIGDFVGAAGKPTALTPQDIAKIQTTTVVPEEGEAPKPKISLGKGDRVKIIRGTFENFEGSVENVDVANGRVTVMISIFARTTPVEFDYWEVEKL